MAAVRERAEWRILLTVPRLHHVFNHPSTAAHSAEQYLKRVNELDRARLSQSTRGLGWDRLPTQAGRLLDHITALERF
jgi:hypothetical protein